MIAHHFEHISIPWVIVLVHLRTHALLRDIGYVKLTDETCFKLANIYINTNFCTFAHVACHSNALTYSKEATDVAGFTWVTRLKRGIITDHLSSG
jgi:hypothetical protein